jgi:hypothetical protein
LERLEYCILLNENGKKRYERGPQVVFPGPTEKFITHTSSGTTLNKYQALELNEQQPPAGHPGCADEDDGCHVAARVPTLLAAPDAGDDFVVSAVSGEVLLRQLLPALGILSAALVAFLAEDPL